MRIRIRGLAFRICYFEFSIESRIYATAVDARPEWSTRNADKSLELLRGAPIAHSEMDLNLFLPYGK